MKKFLILFFSFFLLSISSFAEQLPTPDDPSFSQQNNPVLYKYLKDYSTQLYNAFDGQKYRYDRRGVAFMYHIKRDGTVYKFQGFDSKTRMGKYIKDLVLNNPPPPFPDELVDDHIRVDIYVGHGRYPRNEFYYYRYTERAIITIEK